MLLASTSASRAVSLPAGKQTWQLGSRTQLRVAFVWLLRVSKVLHTSLPVQEHVVQDTTLRVQDASIERLRLGCRQSSHVVRQQALRKQAPYMVIIWQEPSTRQSGSLVTGIQQ